MKRVVLLSVFMVVPGLAGAQTVPPPPPAPAPVAPQAPAPAPQPAPAPRVVVVPPVVDSWMIDQSVRDSLDAWRAIDVEGVREAAQAAAERARADAEDARQAGEQARSQALGQLMQLRNDGRLLMQDQKFMMGQDQESSYYSSGLNYLQQQKYDEAIVRFDRTINQKSAHADGAWYWKAFAQWKLGKTEDAIASIASLRKDYPQSKYLADAKVLEADVRKPRPESVNDDDEIKLLAITGIQNSDPARAAQLCETLLTSSNSLKVKKRALYLLALSDQPRAHEVLLSYAKGGGNPDLQQEAISYLAMHRSKQPTTSAELKQIYESTNDPAIRRTIIDAYRVTGDKAALITLASGGSPVEVKAQAINGLRDVAAPQDLWALYQKEENKDLRISMVRSFSSMGAVDQLLQIAKSDKDPSVRQAALRSLGNQKVDKTGSTLVDMYGTETDKDNKLAIISALGNQGNDTGLVAIARKETKDIECKREIVRRLMDMAGHSKVASDYLLEVIK